MRAHLSLNATLVRFHRIPQELTTEYWLTPKRVTSLNAARKLSLKKSGVVIRVWGETDIFSSLGALIVADSSWQSRRTDS